MVPSVSLLNALDIPLVTFDDPNKRLDIETNDMRYQGSSKEAVVRASFAGTDVDYKLTVDIPCTEYVMHPTSLYSMQTSAMGDLVEQALPTIDSGPYCVLIPVLVNVNGPSVVTLDTAAGTIRVESTQGTDAGATPYDYRVDYYFGATLKHSLDF